MDPLNKIPDIVDTKTKWLAVLSKFYPPIFLFLFGHLVSVTKNGWTKIMLLNTFVLCVQCLSCNALQTMSKITNTNERSVKPLTQCYNIEAEQQIQISPF